MFRGGFIDEYGRVMKYEYAEDKTMILAYHGGHFKSFEDYESWEQPDPNLKSRMDQFLSGRSIQKEMDDAIFSIPSTGALMECAWEGFGMETFSRITGRDKQMKRILSYLFSEKSKLKKPVEEYDDEHLRPFITKNIANGLGVKPQSIISNLKMMEGEGLIQSRRGSINRGEPFKGKTGVKIWWLTDEGKIYATLFDR